MLFCIHKTAWVFSLALPQNLCPSAAVPIAALVFFFVMTFLELQMSIGLVL